MGLPTGENGAVLLALFAFLMPLLLTAASFTSVMAKRSAEHAAVLDDEKALLAAESGIDDAVFRAQSTPPTLQSGVSYNRALGSGLSFTVTPTYLATDGLDNDGDGQIDEADEDVFQILVAGQYRAVQRRVVAYLGPVKVLPNITSAVALLNPNVNFIGKGTPLISGNEVTMTGASTGVSVMGVGVASPGASPTMTATISSYSAGSPQVGPTGPLNFAAVVAEIQNTANLVLTSSKYSSYSFGNGAAGIANVAYRGGDVTFSGNSRGAGVLVVNGDLTITGTFEFDGVVLVAGNIDNSAGTATIRGALIQGPGASTFEIKGTLNIYYSSAAIALANRASGRYVTYNGWQEMERRP